MEKLEMDITQNMEENDTIVGTPTKQEVMNIISQLKNNKSPGATEITAEMLKAGGEQRYEQLYWLVKKIWEEEKMPNDWMLARICPIHKKGDKQTCENYRGIAVLETGYKIIAQLMEEGSSTIRREVSVAESAGAESAGAESAGAESAGAEPAGAETPTPNRRRRNGPSPWKNISV
uniref:Uncharacterized protein LOC114327035 n=1 Tax=Diabrotica virgifera virgifera TaxID=50390 RepID=A0A6P7FD93_DIAVI